MTAQTPDPPGGHIYKDENGELLGKVAENAARLFSAITPSGSTREQRRAGVKLPPPTTYILHKPTGPWQVVLVPDDATGTIRVEGYGQDLSEPLIVKELHVGY